MKSRGPIISQCLFILLAVACCSLLCSPPPATGASGAEKSRAVESLASLPLYFIENQGQADRSVKYYERSRGRVISFTEGGAIFSFAGDPKRNLLPESLTLTLLAARKDLDVSAEEPQAGKVNYLIGKDPARWRTGIPTFRSVVYRDAYPGVDLRFYGNERRLEYDILVKPAGDPSLVRFQYGGAKSLEVEASGDLSVRMNGGRQVIQKKPVIYQEIDGKRVLIEGSFKTDGMVCRIDVPSYDPRHALVIDPVIDFSTYLGGTDTDEAAGIAVDSSGNIYVAGLTYSFDFPRAGSPLQPIFGGGNSDAFVTKISASASGTSLVYATYLGGGDDDEAHAIAVDSSGNAYVAGITYSTDFPLENPIQQAKTAPADQYDAFVAKLDPNGSALVYSTYLGGSNDDYAQGIAVDSSGNAYVTGSTFSGATGSPEDLPFPTTAGAFQTELKGTVNAFVTKINAAGSAWAYSTYLGGEADDHGNAIAVDSTGAAYVAGDSDSYKFPVKKAFQGKLKGMINAFVAKLNPAGTALVYSTYLGGSNADEAYGIAVDASGNAYVTGLTASENFPTTPKAYKRAFQGGDWDAFATKIKASGNVLAYSTYLGGSGDDEAYAIAVDGGGGACVTGFTDSADFPVQNPVQETIHSERDAFVTQLAADGGSLAFSSFLGGSEDDEGHAIAMDARGDAYIAGYTLSFEPSELFPNAIGFPTADPIQSDSAGASDVFVTKIVFPFYADFNADPASGPPPLKVTFTDASARAVKWNWNFGNGKTSTKQNPPAVTYKEGRDYTVTLTVQDVSGNEAQKQKTIHVTPPPPPVAGFTASHETGVAPLTVTFKSVSTGSIDSYAWDFGDAGQPTAGASGKNAVHKYATAGTFTATLAVTGPGGTDAASRLITVTPPAPKVDFTAAPKSGVKPLQVQFTGVDKLKGPVDSWGWDFGDGSTGSGRTPGHTYSVAGRYTVILTATGPGGSFVKTRKNCITVKD